MDNKMLLAVEMGNSATDVALFRGEEILEIEHLPTLEATAAMVANLAERWQAAYECELIPVFASVVPPFIPPVKEALTQNAGRETIYVNTFRTDLIPLQVEQPHAVGVDRVVNAVAAIHLVGRPVLVTSLGTATTFEVIDAEGRYLGGAICPGVGISSEALTQRAALLAPIGWEKPELLIGKTTLEHMQSGTYYGTLSMLQGMTERLREALGCPAPLVGTGGYSHLLAAEGVFDVHEPHLGLKGLALIGRERS